MLHTKKTWDDLAGDEAYASKFVNVGKVGEEVVK